MKSILMVVSNPFVYDQRVYNEAKALVDHGYSVTVFAWDRDHRYNDKEEMDGIEIVRIRGDLVDKILCRRPFQRMHFLRKTHQYITKHIHTFDIVHCHDLDTLALGIRLKKEFRCKLAYDSHEIYLYLIQRDFTRYLTWYYRRLEKLGSHYVDQLIITDVKHEEYFTTRFGYQNFVVVRNTKALVTDEYSPPAENKFQLLYIGTLSKARFLIEAIEVVSALEDVELLVAGSGRTEEEVKAAASDVSNVRFLGLVPIVEIMALTRDSNCVLCMIDPNDWNNRGNLANKQFEAMVCGRPIISTRGTRVAEVTKEENCGIIVDYNREALKNGILELQRNPELCGRMGRNALDAAKRKYSWSFDAERLLSMYQTLENC